MVHVGFWVDAWIWWFLGGLAGWLIWWDFLPCWASCGFGMIWCLCFRVVLIVFRGVDFWFDDAFWFGVVFWPDGGVDLAVLEWFWWF